MKITEHGPKPERVWLLAVSTYLGRRLFTRLVERFPHVKIVRRPKIFSSFRESKFLEFTYKGTLFSVDVEPFSGEEYDIGQA